MQPVRTVAPPDFADRHPELYYTDLRGLQGILASNTLWATHFSYLNDKTEVMLLRDPLAKVLSGRIVTVLKTRPIGNRHIRRTLSRIDVHQEIRILVSAMFEAAFEAGLSAPLAEPFITSFCAHSLDEQYETRNGLLSQWRAYGGDTERYCIVFDTDKIITALMGELEAHYWVQVWIDDVHYAYDNENVEDIFPDLIETCDRYVQDYLTQPLKKIPEKLLLDFLAAAPRYKHQGFREEHEARIVAIVLNNDIVDQLHLLDPDAKVRSRKIIQEPLLRDIKCPYIRLFDTLGQNLPIKRVIVGPSRAQEANSATARALVGDKFPVDCSETPFIG